MPATTAGPAKAAQCFFYRAKTGVKTGLKTAGVSPKVGNLFAGVYIAAPVLPETKVLLSRKKKQVGLLPQKKKNKKSRKKQACRAKRKKRFTNWGVSGKKDRITLSTVPGLGNWNEETC